MYIYIQNTNSNINRFNISYSLAFSSSYFAMKPSGSGLFWASCLIQLCVAWLYEDDDAVAAVFRRFSTHDSGEACELKYLNITVQQKRMLLPEAKLEQN
jgi:hypothetical protein